MPTAREQAGLAEASRLLQEGLQLLDERSREVDALVEAAEQRAREITAEAEERAEQISAEAERRRVELETQFSALQAEVAAMREELGQLRAARQGRGGRPPPVVAPIGVPPLPVEAGAPADVTPAPASEPPLPAVIAPDANPEPQRWGRQSTLDAAQAMRTRARPRWMPRWFPFLLLALPIALVLANMAFGEGLRAPGADSTIQITVEPTSTTAAKTSAAQVLGLTQATVAAPTSLPTAAPVSTQPPARAPTAAAATTTTSANPPTATPAASLNPAATPSAVAAVAPPRTPVVPALVPPPGGPSSEAPIVAVYTTYLSYVVHDGDTLNRIASQFGVPGENIIRASGLPDPNLLQPGQVLTIPRESGWLYRVQPNETLADIARRFGAAPDELVIASMLASPMVRPGDLLFIPNHDLPLFK